MTPTRPVYAVDLETTSLDPTTGTIIAASLCGPGVTVALVDRYNEGALLNEFFDALNELPTDARLTTWNGWGFDLDWIRTRGFNPTVRTSPFTFRESGETSKYGDPLLRATFRGHDIGDVYYQTCWPTWARRQGLESSGLKAVAHAALGVTPHDMDVTRFDEYTDDQIAAYCLDDSRWAWMLWELRGLAAA